MAKITIVANIKAEASKVELLKTELLKLIQPTRAESGCVQYDLHQDNENPAHFMFFEIWESHDAWQTHMNAQHLKDFLVATNGAVVDFAVNQMTKVG